MANDKISSAVDPKLAGLNRSGRPKGAANKTTKAAKEAIHEAFEAMGGIKALVKWAQTSDDNRKVFYSQIWPKIVPLQLTGEGGGAIEIRAVERRVIPVQAEPLKLVSNAST